VVAGRLFQCWVSRFSVREELHDVVSRRGGRRGGCFDPRARTR
jgi:hypothetical protein